MPSSPESDGGGEEGRAPVTEAESPADQDAPDADLARMEDRYKRALADLDNYRKRSAREIDRRVEEARDALLRDWLEAVDSVDRALRLEPESPMVGGLRAVLDQMEAILARYGVQRLGEPGEPFDPTRHEAVDVRSSAEVSEATVLEVLRSGFAVGDRVLRPAQVVVARPERRDET
jgi:molecular chaperone GrpE